MNKKNMNRFIEDNPGTLKFSESPVTEAERKRADTLWKELTGE